MRLKCSLGCSIQLRHLLALVVLLSAVAGCTGARTAADDEAPPAPMDTVAVRGDTAVVGSAVPARIPRAPRSNPAREAIAAAERPAYAHVQPLPVTESTFTQQFAIENATAWSEAIGRGLVSFSMCSGAVVSAMGLVVTSFACLDSLLTRNGVEYQVQDRAHFLAAEGEEMQLAGLSGQYHGRDVSDIRLVFHPDRMLADFGGAEDAGTYPQFKLNVAFLRLYDGGRPLATPEHYAWRTGERPANATYFAVGFSEPNTVSPGAPQTDTLPLDGAVAPAAAVSGGRARGFVYANTEAPPHGTFHGLYDRHHAFGPASPWDLPPFWKDDAPPVPLDRTLSLALTNAVIPSMLGGPVLSRDAAYYGTFYDVNGEMALNDPGRLRLVAVPSSAITLALEEVYGARTLLEELIGGDRSP